MPFRISNFEEYTLEYKKSVENPEDFWAEKAEPFVWRKKWDQVLNWNFKTAETKWYSGGKLNLTENCLDRHLSASGDKTAIIWEPNNPEETHVEWTYNQLYAKVCQLANFLTKEGAQKGDRICIYMPMVPEAAVAMLACARIGAIHSVIFAGFSSGSLADRINDAQAKIILTADGGFRGNKITPIKEIVDQALDQCPSITSCIVLKRTFQPVNMVSGRDKWWHEEVTKEKKEHVAEEMDSEDPLFILYTSGSTGKPKGVVHTTAGYMVFAQYSFLNVFQCNPGDVYWCTADVGWITGHTYLLYGPLLQGTTTVLFEGVPTYPDAGRFWNVIEKHKVNIFYTAPTAIRSLMAAGDSWPAQYQLDSLKVIGSVGEPINEEAWHWYSSHIGKDNCPLVDTWWQTETGGILISPLAGITPTKPSFATLPLPGIQPVIVDSNGQELVGNGVEGILCIKYPWPGIIRTTYGDHQRCKETYFTAYPDLYFTGDGCKRDEDGYYRIMGRVDDVINVSGHRIGTAEVESAINEHIAVVESAVVGFPHPIKGQGLYAYVICETQIADEEKARTEIIAVVNKIIGPIAKPDLIQFVTGLPKTRSGKIMRRILRKIAENDVSNLGDTSTLLDPGIVEEIMAGSLVK